ncbi:MAG: hypothetical protein U0441_06280 [Polyangiaceae bacterium]
MSSARTLGLLLGLGSTAIACGPATPDPAAPAKGTTVATASPTANAATCAEGKGECDGDAKTSCETDLTSSTANCGACGNACAAGQSCVAGGCRAGQSISASGADTCVVSGGHVMCWGDNSYGLIARGSKGAKATPVKIAGIDNAALVRAGSRVGCAVTTEGKVQCFHEGEAHELPLVSDVVDLAMQDSTVILVHKDGKVGAVDVGDSGRDLRPAELPPGVKEASQVVASPYHACALLKSGEVACWGDPAYTGQGKDVSNLDWNVREEMGKKVTRVKDIKDAVQLSASGTHTCAVRKTKQIMCWGSNWSGELGDGSSDHRYAPVAVQLLDDAVEVATGYHHSCARRAGGKVVCWGEGASGQLGGGVSGQRGMIEVQGIADATAITAGDEVSCAARAAGGVSCWGAASRGRLGNGTVSDYTTPQPVKGIAGATALALGDRISCAIDGTKHLSCWGLPSTFEVEPGTRADAPKPVALGEVESVTARDSFLCATEKSGDVSCESTYKFLKSPQKQALGKVKFVRGGTSQGIALTPSGQAVLWARNWEKPGEVFKMNLSGLTDVSSVAIDSSAVCGVKKSGKVGCVGLSYRSFEKKDPIKPTGMIEVPGLTDATAIAGDGGDMCVLRKTSEVTCFSSYRVPPPVDPKAPVPKDKKDKDKPLPIELRPVKGLADVASVVMGSGTRCALLKNGTVSCWGSNTFGQLGTGDYGYSWEPTAVAGLSDVASVAVGVGQVCAIKKGGDVLCWGQNTSDQAGQSAPPFAYSPMSVNLPRD